jgi:hypothetical protein
VAQAHAAAAGIPFHNVNRPMQRTGPTCQVRDVGSEVKRSRMPASPAVLATASLNAPPGTDATVGRSCRMSASMSLLSAHSRRSCSTLHDDIWSGWVTVWLPTMCPRRWSCWMPSPSRNCGVPRRPSVMKKWPRHPRASSAGAMYLSALAPPSSNVISQLSGAAPVTSAGGRPVPASASR